MIDWVNCLKLKLRELKILSPKENIYTKPPGIMKPTIHHRNPTDPLPQRPPTSNNVSSIPGLELVNHTTATTTATAAGAVVSDNEYVNAIGLHLHHTVNVNEFDFANNFNHLNISTFNEIDNDDDDESDEDEADDDESAVNNVAAVPITIPVFNSFSNSNTTSQNLINLLNNPLRHHNISSTAHANFRPFSNVLQSADEQGNVGVIDNGEESDEYIEEIAFVRAGENREVIESQQRHHVVLPTSLHVDYVPDSSSGDDSESLVNRDNITVIEIAEDEQLSQFKKKLKNDPKVTKIKIELEMNDNPIVSVQNSSGRVEKSEVFIASTSSSNASSNSAKAPPVVERRAVVKNVLEVRDLKPTTIAVKEPPPSSQQQAPPTPKRSSDQLGTPRKTPNQEKRKLSLREKQVQQLIHEINTEIRFKVRKKDCVDSMAFVTVYNSIWIAGVRPVPALYCLHVGDQLLAINNIVIKSPADAQKYIKMCSGLFVEITIRRLPLGGIFFIRREYEGQCLGIIRDKGSPAIVEIIPNSISAHIPSRPVFDENSAWIITQINFRNLSLINHKKYDETELLLNSSGLETSLLLQPSEFIARLRKELKANFKNYRDYLLQ